jgi:hypothetical protein
MKPTESAALGTGQTERGASATRASDLSTTSPAQLAANRANAQLSTGPRTEAGRARSSQNAIKSALTGRTLLLPTDDRDEYARFLADFQQQLKPEGQLECELVQIIVDCHWRLRRIQELEFALYAHGHEQFEALFQDCPDSERASRILLQTHLTYEKQFRNSHIQEARIDRKRAKALAELQNLQKQRQAADEDADSDFDDLPDSEAFALLDAGYMPPYLASALANQNRDRDAPARSPLPTTQARLSGTGPFATRPRLASFLQTRKS